MDNLIPVNYDTEEPTVSARDLHEALEINKRFSAWFERVLTTDLPGVSRVTLPAK